MLCIREAWNEFAFGLALINEIEMRTLPYQLYVPKDAMGVQDYAVYNAWTMLTVLSLSIVYLLPERKVVDSIVQGATPRSLDSIWRNLSYSLHLLIGLVDIISLPVDQRRWLAAKC